MGAWGPGHRPISQKWKWGAGRDRGDPALGTATPPAPGKLCALGGGASQGGSPGLSDFIPAARHRCSPAGPSGPVSGALGRFLGAGRGLEGRHHLERLSEHLTGMRGVEGWADGPGGRRGSGAPPGGQGG